MRLVHALRTIKAASRRWTTGTTHEISAQPFANDAERLTSFRSDIDTLHRRVRADLGARDVEYMTSVATVSSACHWAGRALIALSPEPITFTVGVALLAAHKQLQMLEIGHAVLHGSFTVFSDLPEAAPFQPVNFRWDGVQMDKSAWRKSHGQHHAATNVTADDGDPDLVMIAEPKNVDAAYRPVLNLALRALQIACAMDAMHVQVSGVAKAWRDADRAADDHALANASTQFLRSTLCYYAKEYLFYPMLAGPLFPKVFAGNVCSEIFRNIFFGLGVYSNHFGTDAVFSAKKPRGPAAYAHQVNVSSNLTVPWPVAILLGAIETHVEHHLFPAFPPNRCREIAAEVREICLRHGIPYRSTPWSDRLVSVFRMVRDGPVM